MQASTRLLCSSDSYRLPQVEVLDETPSLLTPVGNASAGLTLVYRVRLLAGGP